ncbi:MAG: UDP-N-acetylmuramate dehydrogenase [Pyrinomonadaceae bacterium]|nr:UDP-N-acetylmuramate dehydrogenase [Pyrinomonadaceae bacterium]
MTTSFEIEENVKLAPLTTLGVGGTARRFANVTSEEELAAALRAAGENSLSVFILGGGSNIVVADAGFDGLVIKVSICGIHEAGSDGSRIVLSVGAGEEWDGFVAYAVERGLAGVECLSGIPGLVGGTPVQNVGAYGQEVSETIVSVSCLDRTSGAMVELSNEECGFGYRKSIFNSDERDRYVVTRVNFRLTVNGDPKLAYRELIEIFSGRTPSIVEVREAVLSIRRSKSMVIDPDDPNSRSAGSFFKNPLVTAEKFGELEAAFGEIPKYPAANGWVKVPAAWLIENAGFSKGFAMNRVGISTKHSLAIINKGGAGSADIVELKDLIRSAVNSKFGIQLEPEPIFVGF